MAKLSKTARKKLPAKDFAGPGKTFPIPDKKHARAALMLAPASERKGTITKGQEKKIDARAHKMLGAKKRK